MGNGVREALRRELRRCRAAGTDVILNGCAGFPGAAMALTRCRPDEPFNHIGGQIRDGFQDGGQLIGPELVPARGPRLGLQPLCDLPAALFSQPGLIGVAAG